MYIVDKVVSYRIRDQHSYNVITEGISSELEANKTCLILNNQKEHHEKELEKVKAELAELKSVLP